MTKNFFSLGLSQLSNLLLPFITMPFLIQKVQASGYGKIQFAYITLIFFGFVVEYSHNVTAPREVALNNENAIKLRTIVDRIFSARLFLALIVLALMVLLVLFVPKYGNDRYLFLMGYTIVLGFAFQTNWFFQGIERMAYIAYANILGKGTTLALIFTYIHSSPDYIYVPFFWGLGNLLTAMILLVIIRTNYGYFPRLRPRLIKQELQDGLAIFLSNISIATYMNAGTVILGFNVSDSSLGIYSVAERIVMAARQVLSVFSQVIYPKICKLTIVGHEKMVHYFLSVYSYFTIMVFAGCCFLFFLPEFCVYVITTSEIPEASEILKKMSFIPLIVCLNIPSYQFLMAYNFKNGYTFIMISGSVLFCLLSILLAKMYLIDGVIGSIIVTELYITISLTISWLYYRKQLKTLPIK